MTQTELNVDVDELLKRATALEGISFYKNFPKSAPEPPSQMYEVMEATIAIGATDKETRLNVRDADRRLKELVDAIREAVKYYEETDTTAAESIANNETPSAVTPKPADTDATPPASSADDNGVSGLSLPSTNNTDVLARARLFYQTGDRGASMLAYATDLRSFANYVMSSATMFRDFDSYKGEGADALNTSLKSWRACLKTLADDCNASAKQATDVERAFKGIWTDEVLKQYHRDPDLEIARLQRGHNSDGKTKGGKWFHPQPETVEWVDRICKGDVSGLTGMSSDASRWAWQTTLTILTFGMAAPAMLTGIGVGDHWKKAAPKVYATLQTISDEAVANFHEDAKFKDVSGRKTPPPLTSSWTNNNPGGKPYIPPKPKPDPNKDPVVPNPLDSLPTAPEIPTMPTMPEMPSDVPTDSALSDGVLGGAVAGSSKLPTGGMGMRAASVGGGGMPLQPPVAAEGAGSAAGRGGPNVGGAGAQAGGAAMGGRGGMGMVPPMAGQGGKGEDSKAKRAQQEEEALYAEDRPWTEAVIGNRRRKDGPDNKESK